MKYGDVKKKPATNWFLKKTPSAWILPFLYNHMWIAATFALIQPFFPILASSKSLDAWKYGLVFSTYKLAMLAGSQGAHRAMSATSPLAIYMAGLGGYVIFCMLQGSLHWLASGNVLLGVSFVAAGIGGCADSITSVVTFAIITDHFKKRSGIVIASLEFLRQVGGILGTVLGGILIDLWAFPLPHYLFGIFLVMSAIFMLKLQTRLNQGSAADDAKEKLIPENSSPNYWTLFRSPLFLIDMVSIMMSWMTLGFNDTTLEPSLKKFRLNNTEIGGIFMFQYASCAVGAILSGVFCHYKAETFCSLIGHVFAALAYILWGPAPFIKCEGSLWMVYLSQVFTGLSSAAMFTGPYSHALKVVGEVIKPPKCQLEDEVMRLLAPVDSCLLASAVLYGFWQRAFRFRGFSETIRTKGFVSSSVFTFLVIGGMITPPFAAQLVGILGFRMATMSFSCLLATWVPVTFAVWIRSTCTRAKIRTSDSTS